MTCLLKDEVFSLVPSKEAGRFWAGPEKTKKRIDRLVQQLCTRRESTVDLLWATFGSGKTHTLRYIESEIGQRDCKNVCIFLEMTESLRSFVDLYKQFAQALDWNRIAELSLSSSASLPPDFRRAMHLIANKHSLNSHIAMDWLLGARLDLRQLKRETNIGRRIETDVDSLSILSAVSNVIEMHGGKLVILIDEYQRMAAVGQKHRNAITSTLRTFFNGSPRGLGLVLALTSALEQTAMALLPSEIRTLVGPKPAITLPEFEPEDAFRFCVERMAYFRPSSYNGDPYSPFDERILRSTIQYLNEKENVRLIPRNIIHCLAWIHDEVTSLTGGSLSHFDVGETLDCLRWDSDR